MTKRKKQWYEIVEKQEDLTREIFGLADWFLCLRGVKRFARAIVKELLDSSEPIKPFKDIDAKKLYDYALSICGRVPSRFDKKYDKFMDRQAHILLDRCKILYWAQGQLGIIKMGLFS